MIDHQIDRNPIPAGDHRERVTKVDVGGTKHRERHHRTRVSPTRRTHNGPVSSDDMFPMPAM